MSRISNTEGKQEIEMVMAERHASQEASVKHFGTVDDVSKLFDKDELGGVDCSSESDGDKFVMICLKSSGSWHSKR